MNPVSDKIISLAKKIKALADRGVDGEKHNAIHKLEALMIKYEITNEMLNGIDEKEHQLYLEPEKALFFRQIVSSVIGRGYKFISYKYKIKRNKGKNRYGIRYCTDTDFIEIMAKFEFFDAHYERELDLFYDAFIQKNRLWVKVSEEYSTNDKEEIELSLKEKQRLWAIANMMEGMERKVFVKQLD